MIDYKATGLLRSHEMDAEKLAKSLAGAALPDAEVTDTEVLKMEHGSVHLRGEAKAETLGEINDGVLILDLPHAPRGVIGTLPRTCRIQEPERFTPLFLPGSVSEEMNLRLTLPKDMAIDFAPAERTVQTAGAEYTLARQIEDGVITVQRSIALPGGRIETSGWPAFRELLAAVRVASAGHVVLREE